MEVTLDDGNTVEVPSDRVRDLYDQLWLLVPQRGAVTAATKVQRGGIFMHHQERVVLDARETTAFTIALRHLDAQ